MKRLIINADDFGMSPEFNAAIVDLLENRHISSASLMPVAPAYEDAVKLVKQRNLKNIGIHLTLTRENFGIKTQLTYKSLTGISSITDYEGYLLPGRELFLKKALDADITNELMAQFYKFQLDGISISHIDCHMYSLFPYLGKRGLKLLFNVYKNFNFKLITGIRFAKNYYFFPDINYVWTGRKLNFWLRWKLFFLNLTGVDFSFAFPYCAPNHPTLKQKQNLLHNFFVNLREGVTEIHFHPAIYSDNLCLQNPYWQNRVHEYELLKSLTPKSLKRDYGIELSYYN
ncbi:MAG: ChbG/HpnK family deacetylase [Erysipelotrichales bacterium]|nr:ChbG/HpnK family deacetylase [Erysipelotrichales bacterium]